MSWQLQNALVTEGSASAGNMIKARLRFYLVMSREALLESP